MCIGINLPEFRVYKKHNFIFACHRHWPQFQSIEVAKWAQKYKVKTIFAGPICGDYPLKDYIDNKYTYYLGEIPDQLKIEYYQSARLTTLIHNWPTPMSLSALEALAYGCPVACNLNKGFWPTLIQDGINGFHIDCQKNSTFEGSYYQEQFDKYLNRSL